jgi:hypothetical protein
VDPTKKEADMSEDLNRVMRGATENLHPNIGKLTAGGIERGVRKRRVRRISQIAGAAASVTAVFGVVAAVGTSGHGTPAGVSAAAGSPAAAAQTTPAAGSTHTPVATPTPPASPATSASGPAAPPVSGDDMAKWLKESLKTYHFTGEQVLYKAASNEAAGPFATMKIGYPTGAGSLSLNIAQSSWSSQSVQGTVPFITVTNLPDGSHLMVFDGPEWPAGNGDPTAKRLDVAWYRTDGTMVDVMVLNAVQEKGATTASGLGLTVDQATKLVQSPVWDKAIAAVLANPAGGMPKGGAVPPSGGQTPNSTDVTGK